MTAHVALDAADERLVRCICGHEVPARHIEQVAFIGPRCTACRISIRRRQKRLHRQRVLSRLQRSQAL